MRIPDGVQGRSVFNEGKIMQLTPDEIEAERVRFEAWMTKRHGTLNFRREFTSEYEVWWIYHAWQGWLAAKQDAKEQA